MSRPLDGIRVLEVASWIMVPACGAILADWGAAVIKVEHPLRGDPARGLVSGPALPGQSQVNYLLHSVNRGKRSVGIDIARPEGLRVLQRLAGSCDVFLTSSLPSVRARLKIDVSDIRDHNPRIIYAKGSGLGPRGEERDKGGFDSASFWARGGIADTYHQRALEYPVLQNGAFGDLMTAAVLAGGISTALVRRERTGEPSTVDASLFGMSAWLLSREIAMAAAGDPYVVQPQLDRSETFNPLTNIYRTKDGRFLAIVGLQSDKDWPELCCLLDRHHLVDDPRFTDAVARAEHRVELIRLLDEAFATRTLVEWSEHMTHSRIVWEPVQSAAEVSHDRALVANDYLMPLDEPAAGAPSHLVTPPVQFDESSVPARRAPELGEHTETVLLELGLDWEELAQLKTTAAIS